ncbi:MAG: hypothetical protein HUU04_10300 [Verrucomicrobiae bacterium]|nr:hypothetical protein [Verrucomicrobiae bacterium]
MTKTPRTMKPLHLGRISLLLLLAAGVSSAIERARHADVAYVEDFLAKPLVLRALKPTPLAFSRDGSGVMDWLFEKQKVAVIGLGPDRHLVRATISNGKAEGWVLAGDLEKPSPEILAELEKGQKEAERMRHAIAQGEVVIGMPQEVVLKILGKPGARSSVREAGGEFEQWTWTTYKTVPYDVPATINGTNVVTTLYRKVPVGTKVATFQGNQVIRFEQKEEPIHPKATGGGIVVPPIILQ